MPTVYMLRPYVWGTYVVRRIRIIRIESIGQLRYTNVVIVAYNSTMHGHHRLMRPKKLQRQASWRCLATAILLSTAVDLKAISEHKPVVPSHFSMLTALWMYIMSIHNADGIKCNMCPNSVLCGSANVPNFLPRMLCCTYKLVNQESALGEL